MDKIFRYRRSIIIATSEIEFVINKSNDPNV